MKDETIIAILCLMMTCICCFFYSLRRKIEPFAIAAKGFAIVCMARNPHQITHWLRHHIQLGASVIYLYFDDPDDGSIGVADNFAPMVSVYVLNPATLGTLQYSESETSGMDLSQRNMYRQQLCVSHAISKARDAAIKFIVHIDSDELLFSPANLDVCDTFAKASKQSNLFHITNWELAIERHDYGNCFQEAKTFRTAGKNYVAYGNGKGAALITRETEPYGVHRFKDSSDESFSLDPEHLVVLHYVSCNYQEMLKKHDYFRSFKDDDCLWAQAYRQNRDDLSKCQDAACRRQVCQEALDRRKPTLDDSIRLI